MAGKEPGRQGAPAAEPGGASRAVLFLTVFIDLLGFGIVIPFLPMFAKRLGVGAVGVGLILAVYSLAQFVCAPILGRISDGMGRRPVIMLGLLGSSLGYFIYGFASSFVGLLLSRAVHGACAGTITAAQAYIADTTSEQTRAKGMGLIGAAFGLGFVLGPGIGGLLGHSNLRTPALFASALTFANLIFAAFKLPESHQPQRRAPRNWVRLLAPLRAIRAGLLNRRLARLLVLAFLLTFVLAALEATFALMVPEVYGYGPFGIGVLLAYAGLIQALAQGYLLGRIVGRLGEARLSRGAIVMLGAGLAPMGTLRPEGTLPLLLALVALGYGLGSPCLASLISLGAERRKQGEILGANQAALSLARILGPLAGGAIYQRLGPASPYLGGALFMAVAWLIARDLDLVAT